MIRNSFVTILVVVVLLGAGCSKQYGHARLDKSAAEFAKVKEMLNQLQQADDLEVLFAQQIAGGLDDQLAEGIKITLSNLSAAKEVSLQRVDRWGEKMYRATIEYTQAGQPHSLALLLIADEEKLYWARIN